MSDLRLLVPMNIEALVFGRKAQKTAGVELTPQFASVYYNTFLGQQLEREACDSTTSDLYEGPGVHLHWALPDGLTHGVAGNNGGKPEFPSIPNRWCIVRFWDHGGETQPLDLKCRAWIVESDTITDDEDAVLWPLLGSDNLNPKNERDYSVFVGKQWELNLWPGETAPRSVDLTAIGYGDPTFAASYPACKGMLGFHDHDFADVKDGATLTYMVVGWYADPSKDPLHAAVTDKTDVDPGVELDAFLKKTQWIYPGFAEAIQAKPADLKNLPTHLLCHGLLTGIQWQETIDSGIPRGKPFRISMGETAVDALTTLFASDNDGLRKLLAAFQYDLLTELEKPGGEAILGSKVHERTFRPSMRGIRWDLQQDTRPAFGSASEERTPPIPGDVRALLEQLNTSQRHINRLKRERDSFRSELYATWYKKVLNTTEKKGKSEDALHQRLTKLQEEITKLTVAITDLEEGKEKRPHGAEWEKIQQHLATFLPGWQLQRFEEPEFWRPNDPVVLLAGEALRRSARHGEDGRYRAADGRLLCRLSGQEITAIKIKIPFAKKPDVTFGPPDLDQWCNPFAASGGRLIPLAIPSEVINLFRESLLLTLDPESRDKKQPPYDPSSFKRARDIMTKVYERNESGLAKDHAQEVENLSHALLSTYLKKVWEDANNPDREKPQLRYPETDEAGEPTWELVGSFPSPIVMNRWEKNPWLPLFLQWQVSWTPTYAETSEALAQWKLNDQGTAFKETASPQGRTQVYRGTTVLTPSATVQFSDRLRQYNLSYNNKKLKSLQTAIHSMDVLCQSLGGLTDQLLMRESHVELRPLEPGSGDAGPQFSPIFDAVKEIDWLSPMTEGKFFPVRAGHLQLEKLWVIDAFGQFLQLENENPDCLAANGALRLEPRLAQPARLSLHWLPADRWEAEKEAAPALRAEEESNPICGWILPNYLDKGLMIYDANGYALGALQAVERKSWRDGAGAAKTKTIESFHWIDIPGSTTFFFGKPAEQIVDPLRANANPHLRAFVKGLLSLTEGAGQAFADLLGTMNEALSASSGAGSSHNPNLALLIGQPLALVRAALHLEFDGGMACAQGWDATPTTTDGIEQLEVPIRLGDRRKWQGMWLGDDGLIGFFLNQHYDRFYPAFGLEGRNDSYNTYGEEPRLSSEKPLALTLLMDPARGVRATTGILPRTHFHLPFGDMAETLDNKQVVFFTGPVVSPTSEKEIHMPQPSDLYGQWSWTHHPEVQMWGEESIVDVQKEQGRFSDTPLQIAEGWLKLITAPLAVRVLTVKGKNPVPTAEEEKPQPEGKPPIPPCFEVTAGEQIVLSWSVIGAEKIELQEETSEGTPVVLFKSHRHPLPTQYAIQVSQPTSFTLIATTKNQQEPASKTITITVKGT